MIGEGAVVERAPAVRAAQPSHLRNGIARRYPGRVNAADAAALGSLTTRDRDTRRIDRAGS